MKKVTRRDFLKIGLTGAVVGFGGSLSGCFSPPPPAKKVVRQTGKVVTVASTCALCPAGCGVLGEVQDGRILRILGNPKHPNNRGKLCARGHAGLNVIYDPERLLYPLKRSGARGEGKWTRIGWDQAIEEISKRVSDLYRAKRSEAFWLETGEPGARELLPGHFLKALGSPTVFADASFPHETGSAAYSLTWGAEGAVPDVAKARFILNFGVNPYENHEFYIPLAQRIVEARLNNAAKMITFEVRNSNTAGKSHEWFPVNPGTDAIVALAMAHHIVKQGLHDRDFLTRWTNLPVAKLEEHLARYTPEQAEKVSGVKAAEIRRIAVDFAQTKPAVAISGRGVSGHKNGVAGERCIALLNAVVGNIDAPGGLCLPRVGDVGEPKWKSAYASSAQAIAALKEGKGSPDIYFAYKANPAYANPNSAETVQILKDEKKIPFLVVADTQLTETGIFADLLLPMATYLESWNLETRPSLEMVPFVAIRQAMVAPLGKSMRFGDLCLEVAKKAGGDLAKALPYSGSEDFVNKAAAKVEGLADARKLDALKTDGVYFEASAKPAYRSFEKKGFSTPTGKFELYSKRLEERGLPALPAYVPVEGFNWMKENELILAVNRANVMTPALGNAKWLVEILHDNPLWMNAETAAARGLHEGDRVKVISAAGSLVARLRLSQGVHPKVVTLTEGLGHTQLGAFAKAKKGKSSDFDTGEIWWAEEGHGANPSAVLAAEFEPAGGGICWMDTKVIVQKV